MKPKLFVGSSVEGLDIAYAIQSNLERDAEVTVWNQGLFELTRTALSDLLKALDACDFAAFVFSPDDLSRIRDQEVRTVRDNVVFELGLFMGRLGAERVFFLIPRGHDDLRLPTDLAGITAGTYQPDRHDGNLQAALGPACHQIRKQLRKAGTLPRHRPLAETSVSGTAAGHSGPVPHPDDKTRALSRFLVTLIKHSRFYAVHINRILAVFSQVFETGCLVKPADPPLPLVELTPVTAATLFRLTRDGKWLEQIGFTGDVAETGRFPLDDTNNYVVASFQNDVMVLGEKESMTGMDFDREYIMCTPIARRFVLTVHVAVRRLYTAAPPHQLILEGLHQKNRHVLNMLHTYLEREIGHEKRPQTSLF